MTIHTLLLVLLSFIFLGCTPTLSKHPQPDSTESVGSSSSSYIPPDAEKEEIFQKAMYQIGLKIQGDDTYQHIDFETPEEKKWFKVLTYRLWDRQITRHQFLSEALAKYPQNKYEFEFIIRHFTV
jgi:hypothetical protein